MALSFPRTDLFSLIGFNTQDFTMVSRNQMSRQQDGRARAKKLGPQVFMGTWTSVDKPLDVILDMEAVLNSMEDGVFSFYAGDLRRQYPKLRSGGGFVDDAIIASIGSNRKSMTISGADAGFPISRGDYFHIDYDDGAGHNFRYLGQAMETVTCNGSGLSPLFEFRPHFPDAMITGKTVIFKKPQGVFKLVAGSVKTEKADEANQRISFSGYQVLAKS